MDPKKEKIVKKSEPEKKESKDKASTKKALIAEGKLDKDGKVIENTKWTEHKQNNESNSAVLGKTPSTKQDPFDDVMKGILQTMNELEVDEKNESPEMLMDTLKGLEKRKDFLANNIPQLEAQAKKFVAQGNNDGASLCMTRKKENEIELEQIFEDILNLEDRLMSQEEEDLSQQEVEAAQLGASAMKEIHKEMARIINDEEEDDQEENEDGQKTE